jgi:hypothetical protein
VHGLLLRAPVDSESDSGPESHAPADGVPGGVTGIAKTADQGGWPMSRLARLILYHQNPVSARTRFLMLKYGGVCAFEPLPVDLRLLERGEHPAVVVVHPGWLLHRAERWLKLEHGSLELNPHFHEHVESADTQMSIYLARFATFEPPFMEVGWQGGRFIALTDARGLPAVELELLRRAYLLIMG